ncbi:MAG: hypothetical protein JNL74_23810 [Fibrobacteres bacterium]|nr:hypothetical protein [Fibrobacterota bacterium]
MKNVLIVSLLVLLVGCGKDRKIYESTKAIDLKIDSLWRIQISGDNLLQQEKDRASAIYQLAYDKYLILKPLQNDQKSKYRDSAYLAEAKLSELKKTFKEREDAIIQREREILNSTPLGEKDEELFVSYAWGIKAEMFKGSYRLITYVFKKDKSLKYEMFMVGVDDDVVMKTTAKGTWSFEGNKIKVSYKPITFTAINGSTQEGEIEEKYLAVDGRGDNAVIIGDFDQRLRRFDLSRVDSD